MCEILGIVCWHFIGGSKEGGAPLWTHLGHISYIIMQFSEQVGVGFGVGTPNLGNSGPPLQRSMKMKKKLLSFLQRAMCAKWQFIFYISWQLRRQSWCVIATNTCHELNAFKTSWIHLQYERFSLLKNGRQCTFIRLLVCYVIV